MAYKVDENGNITMIQGDSVEIALDGIPTDQNYKVFFAAQTEDRTPIGNEIEVDSLGKSSVVIKLEGNYTNQFTVEEEKKTHPYGTKLVAKHYIKYSIPRKDFENKIKKLYKELFFENVKKHVFGNTEKLITDILDMDSDNAYKNRGGYDKEVIDEDGTAAGGGAGATNAFGVGGQYTTPMSPIQRKSFWKPALKRNKDEKNGSMTMNRQK